MEIVADFRLIQTITAISNFHFIIHLLQQFKFVIDVNMLSEAVSCPEKKRIYLISRMLPQLVHPQTRFSPATLSYDMHSYVFLIHPLTWKFCHICCKHGRIQ